MPCGAHCFILYLQAGFHLSPPLSFCAEDDLKAKQPLLLLSGLYAPFASGGRGEQSGQASAHPSHLHRPIAPHTAEMPAAAATAAMPCSEHIHCVTSLWNQGPHVIRMQFSKFACRFPPSTVVLPFLSVMSLQIVCEHRYDTLE